MTKTILANELVNAVLLPGEGRTFSASKLQIGSNP